MSEALIDKVLRLLALSGSENEHEAKNAAVHACRLIREGIRDSTLILSSATAAPPVSPAVARARANVEAAMRSEGRGGQWVDREPRGPSREADEAWEAFKKRGYK